MEEADRKIGEIFNREMGVRVSSLEELTGGGSHHTYIVSLEDGQEYVLKASDYDWSGLPDHEHGFPVDGPLLQFLDEKEVPTPEVVRFDNSLEEFDFRYLISEKVPGDNFFENWESGDLSTVEEAGRILGRLHSSVSFRTHGKLGWEDEGRDFRVVKEMEWLEMVEDMVHTFSDNMEEQTEFSRYGDEIRELFHENKEVLREDPSSVIVHQEFSPRNMIVEDCDVTAVIDWERVISGDPEYDLFIAEKQFTAKTELFNEADEDVEEIHEALRKGYTDVRNLEEGWQERRKIYQLIFMTQVMWLLDDIVDRDNLINGYEELKEEIRNI